MSRFDRIVSIGFKDGDVDTAISMNAAELSETSADEIRQALIKALEKFDEFRKTWPRSPRPKRLYPQVIVGGKQ